MSNDLPVQNFQPLTGWDIKYKHEVHMHQVVKLTGLKRTASLVWTQSWSPTMAHIPQHFPPSPQRSTLQKRFPPKLFLWWALLKKRGESKRKIRAQGCGLEEVKTRHHVLSLGSQECFVIRYFSSLPHLHYRENPFPECSKVPIINFKHMKYS